MRSSRIVPGRIPFALQLKESSWRFLVRTSRMCMHMTQTAWAAVNWYLLFQAKNLASFGRHGCFTWTMGCLDYTHAIPNTNLCWHLNTSCCNLSHMETVRGNGARLFRNHMFTFRKSLYHLFKLLPHPSRIGIRDANRSWEVAPNSTKKRPSHLQFGWRPLARCRV